jgi:hypothetical protein
VGATQTDIDPAIDTGPLPFERRHDDRAPVSGSYVAVVIDGDQARLTSAELVDESDTGLGFRCPIDLRPGAICHLHPHGVIALADVGRVARCTRDADGYRVGLVSLRRRAA